MFAKSYVTNDELDDDDLPIALDDGGKFGWTAAGVGMIVVRILTLNLFSQFQKMELSTKAFSTGLFRIDVKKEATPCDFSCWICKLVMAVERMYYAWQQMDLCFRCIPHEQNMHFHVRRYAWGHAPWL